MNCIVALTTIVSRLLLTRARTQAIGRQTGEHEAVIIAVVEYKSPGWRQIRGWPAECTCPPLQPQARLCPQDNQHSRNAPVQRTREVTLDPGASAATPVRTKGQAEPARTGRGPSPAQCGRSRGSFMIRNIRGMISAARGMSDRLQAGRVHKFARSDSRTP